MKLLKIYISFLFFSSCMHPMEDEHPRTYKEQRQFDRALRDLFLGRASPLYTPDKWVERIRSMIQSSRSLIEQGIDIVSQTDETPAYAYFNSGTESITSIDYALRSLLEQNNILPLMVLLEMGLDVNHIKNGVPLFFHVLATDEHSINIMYKNTLKFSMYESDHDTLHNIVSWPRGPIRK